MKIIVGMGADRMIRMRGIVLEGEFVRELSATGL